jgi:hypothetical protein
VGWVVVNLGGWVVEFELVELVGWLIWLVSWWVGFGWLIGWLNWLNLVSWWVGGWLNLVDG